MNRSSTHRLPSPAALGLVLLALAGCSSATEAQPAPPGFSRCPSSRGQAFCGTIRVPEDHDRPDGRQISLRVTILPGSEPGTSPVFFLAGGPGQAVGDLQGSIVGRFGEGLMGRDLVLVDQRGTGGSNALRCPTEAPTDPERFFGPHYTEDEVRSCQAEFETRADLRKYRTIDFVRDLDRVRDELGYEEIDLVGGSYGTKVALVFMRTFPSRVRTATLEGAAPPGFLNPLPHARGSQDAIEDLFGDCLADRLCAGNYPDLEARFHALLDDLEREPRVVEVPGSSVTATLDRPTFAFLTHVLMFSTPGAAMVPELIRTVEAGQYHVLTGINRQILDGLVGGIYFGLQLAVTCAEDEPGLRGVDIDAEVAGTYLGRSMVDGVLQNCDGWPATAVAPEFYLPVTGDVPTLLVAGAVDPATPPGFAEDVARDLGDAALFRIEEGAHITPHPCVNDLVVDFIVRGETTGLDGSCLSQIRRPPFATPGS